MAKQFYSPASYDQFLCLRPPAFLWITILYLSRAIALPLLMGVVASSGGANDMQALASGHPTLQMLLPAAIALVVPLAFIRRVPSASRVPRWIWAHGRTFLVASALLDLALLFSDWWLPGSAPTQWNELTVLSAVLDLWFAAYVLLSKRVRDVFSDFPQPI